MLRKRSIGIVLVLILLLMISLVTPIAAQDSTEGFGEGRTEIIAAPAAIPMGAGCFNYWVARLRYTAGGALMYRYQQTIDWCTNGVKITSGTRTITPTTYLPKVSFRRHYLSQETGGIGKRSYTSYVQGLFCSAGGGNPCKNKYYPWVQIRVFGDGRVSWSAGG